jgi:CNT family concentrative nucleoside transporter
MSGLLGILVMLLVAWAASEARGAIRYGDAARTLALQIGIAALAILTPVGTAILGACSRGVQQAINYANDGIRFMFGPLADPGGGVILAFQVLPVIIFIAAVFSILFHLGVMNVVIRFIGGGIRRLTGASKLESTCSAANIFVGMAEAPLTILPYLPKLSRAQLFTVMALGLASVSGSVLAAYAALGMRADLLLTAAFMAAPGGLLMARLLVPETGEAFDIDKPDQAPVRRSSSIIDAATTGAQTGLNIMLSVIAVLVAFVAIIALINGITGMVGGWFGYPDVTVQSLLGYLFAPVAWLIGVPWGEAVQAGPFLSEKVIVNEFLAYANFTAVKDGFSEQGQIAMTIALCGFANLTGLAILIAGLSAVIPDRRTEVSALGLKTVLAGTLSNFMSAAIVSVMFAIKAFF